MPRQNWTYETQADGQGRVCLTLRLGVSDLVDLAKDLKEKLSRSNARYTIYLPQVAGQQWTLHWTVRTTGESRVTLAHPEVSEWVGMVALTEKHLQTFIERAEAARISETYRLEDLGSIWRLSNLRLVVLVI